MLEASPEITMLREISQNRLAEWLGMDGEEAMLRIGEYLTDTMREEWYSGPNEYQATLDRYIQQLGRIIDFFRNNGLVFVSGRKDFTVKIKNARIDDRTNFCYSDTEGVLHYVRLEMFHSNPYSKKARKPENLPKYSLELLISCMGIKNTDAVYEIWYLRSKNDRKGVYPEFEDKEGANIASFIPAETDEDGGISSAFTEAVRLNKKEFTAETCESCRLRGVCRGYKETPCFVTEPETGTVSKDAVPKLTPSQEKVASFRDGTLACIAVPGSGKTFVLVERMKRLIQSGVRPENLLFLSHTRKAVEEIQERVAKTLGIDREDDSMPEVLTLNGFGYNILRDNENLLGTLKLAGDAERKELEEQLMNDRSVQKFEGYSYTNLLGRNGLLDRVDRWVNCLIQNGEDEVIRRYHIEGVNLIILKEFREHLDRLMEANGYIRYDQQIEMVVQLFKEHPELAKGYSKVYRYVMVDEYQDVNEAQDEMVRLLCVHGNLVVVGDDDQSIYGWRGGSNRFLINFAKEHASVVMADNFRTNNLIANLANVTISANRERINKVIKAGRSARLKPLLIEKGESSELVKYAASMCRKYGAENVAVLARDNRTLIDFASVLDSAGIAHASPKDYLITSKVFGVIRDVLRVHALGPDEASESFARLYNSYVGVCEESAAFDEGYAQMLVRTGRLLPVEDTVKNALAYKKCPAEAGYKAFGEALFTSYKVLNYGETIEEVMTGIFDCWFDGTENELVVLRSLLEMFDEGRVMTADQALRTMDRLVKYNDMTRVDYNYGKGFVKMYTSHDAKGKEFDAVLLLDIDQFLWGGTEEDLRVLYVAMTRARHTLVMSTSGTEKENAVLDEIRKACTDINRK